MVDSSQLFDTLQRYWGYSSFRPLQERVVRSILDGRDCAVVMPTGGGKSLCYQLPALLLDGTAIVVSPLIALMQDQVAQLRQMGITAAFLNSAVSSSERSRTMNGATQGAYRLLYLSPERMANPETIDWLRRVPISLFAIDEAHCISEWGHEFRPDYRQLRSLRIHFPDKPIAAFTASATRRARHDILTQLDLREPDKYIASFHRPNLRYTVRECADQNTQERLLLAAVEEYAGENFIVYAPTIARVEELTTWLRQKGIPALGYHGKMEAAQRKQNQERWMADEVPVLVGTIAFGMGINKGSVRAIVHLSLPKSLEQYYQEAGRGGRDGLPADCVLLWRKQDTGLLAHFIASTTDPAERERAWERYRVVRQFAETDDCRSRRICLHFGETPKWESCGQCDICSGLPEWMQAADAHKSKRRPGVTSRIGPQPRPVSRSNQSDTEAPGIADPVNPELFAHLRAWRKALAKEQSVPAFVIFGDKTLEDLCRKLPRTTEQLLSVSGIGQHKAELYGPDILRALRSFQSGAPGDPLSAAQA